MFITFVSAWEQIFMIVINDPKVNNGNGVSSSSIGVLNIASIIDCHSAKSSFFQLNIESSWGLHGFRTNKHRMAISNNLKIKLTN